MKKEKTVAAADAVADAVPETDEHAGCGGSYEIDPGTGKRVLRERTAAPGDVNSMKEQKNGTTEA